MPVGLSLVVIPFERAENTLSRIWAGIDAGKTHHHCVVINEDGKRLLSRRVGNDEPELAQLITDVTAFGDEVTWAIDLADGAAALVIALLLRDSQVLVYIPGRTVNRAAAGYRGEGKTDARDAAVIADQARMRHDLHPLRPGDHITTELAVLTAHRADLVEDRTRVINRLRAQLSGIFPGLERVLDVTNTGPATLLTGYQTPAALRRLGATRLEAWLRARKVRGAAKLATAAIEAAARQHTRLAAEDTIAEIIAVLAVQVLDLNRVIRDLEQRITERFRQHAHAKPIESLPGIGPLLGAEFLAATGGDMTAFGNPNRLAGFAGLAPAPRDSGRVSGNLRRPMRYSRRLQRVFYHSAFIAIQRNTESRRFYDRKRAEGKRHTQAILALARRRVNVLWALIRDSRCYHEPLPTTT